MSAPLCASHPDADMWFRDDNASIAAAKAICARCPIRDRCAEAGRDEAWGVWGGLDAGERLGLMLLATPVPEVIHDRTRYVQQGCRCPVCTEDNRRYVAAWRQREPHVTEHGTVAFEQLALVSP